MDNSVFTCNLKFKYAERLTTCLTKNNFIDLTLQKAFLPGINGVIEHNIVMEEVVKDAKAKNHTLHMTFFNCEDAFGSVPHALIEDALTRHYLPKNVIQYFNNSYMNTKAVVETKAWRSFPFPFKRGVFQADMENVGILGSRIPFFLPPPPP